MADRLDRRRLREAAFFPDLTQLSVSFAFELRTGMERAALRLGWIHHRLERDHPAVFDKLIKPVRSYLDDVTFGDPGTNGRPLLFAAAAADPDDRSRHVRLYRHAEWSYEFEGCHTVLETPERRRSAVFLLRDSFCAFASGRLFYLLTLTLPASGAEPLDEYAILQLQQLTMDETLASEADFLAFGFADAPEAEGEEAGRLSLRQFAARRLSRLSRSAEVNGLANIIQPFELLCAKQHAPVWSEAMLANPDAKPAGTNVTASLAGLCVAVADDGLLEVAQFTDTRFAGEARQRSDDPPPESRQSRLKAAWDALCAQPVEPRPHREPDTSLSRGALVIAGLAQGVPDFPKQDASEVHDASRPAAASLESLLFVHPHFILDIGTNWRSFDHGRPVVGTCPYLLLMWAVAVHDELVVKEIEKELDHALFDSKEEARAQPIADVRTVIGKARRLWGDSSDILETNLVHRLELFRWSAIHRSGNIFRYPRERGALQAIQRELGTAERFDRAERTAAQLEAIVEDVAALKSSYAERRTNRILLIIAIFGVFSVAHDVSEHYDKPRPLDLTAIAFAATDWPYLITVVLLLVILAIVMLWQQLRGPPE